MGNRGGYHVTTEAEMEDVSAGQQGWWKVRGRELSGWVQPYGHVDFRHAPSRMLREWVSVVISPMCGQVCAIAALGYSHWIH